MNSSAHPFDRLTPDFLMSAVESQDYWCDGRQFPLNSYENRVYQIGIESAEPLIAKFYRPQRWSQAQILEEHEFCFELVEQELPVVAPLRNRAGQSLYEYEGFYFALYPRKGGRAPELDNPDNLLILGRLLARIHAVGAVGEFRQRPAISFEDYGEASVQLITEQFIPDELKEAYITLCADLLRLIRSALDEFPGVRKLRTHGDCHIGNILWRDENPHFVDFDDARTAPAIQDIWMLLCGDRHNQTAQLAEILDGYDEFYSFDARELNLIEAYRTLRMMHYSAWLARRWADPAFPRAFPWFNTMKYWGEHILELREQFSALQEPPLQVG